MENENQAIRIVPNIYSDNMTECKAFYQEFLELELAMDMGWIYTFTSKSNRLAQISIIRNDKDKIDNSGVFISVEVPDVDKKYELARQLHCNIVYDITDESWGVRRFFVKDPNGAIINVLSHL